MPSAAPVSFPGRLAARPVIEPFPGWVLGSGQSADLMTGLRRKFWRLLWSPFEIEWLEGLRLTMYPGNEICRSIFVTGCYEPNEFSWLNRILKPGMTFLDAGANLGLYTMFAAKRVAESGRVIAIEPSSREMERLRRNVELNSLANVSLLPLALSDCSDEAELLVAAASHAGHNTLGSFGYNTQLAHREKVRTMRLDDLMESAKLESVDVIKMDIEGAELAALRGGTVTLERWHPILLIEVSDRALNHQQASSAEIVSLLAGSGYDLYFFDPASGLPAALPTRECFDSENIIAAPKGIRPW